MNKVVFRAVEKQIAEGSAKVNQSMGALAFPVSVWASMKNCQFCGWSGGPSQDLLPSGHVWS